ncbi:MAG: response regulator transcription factor [Halanaerobiales bacterium]|nr:response regulator transcription factor [Halanaerobiales bacterium]
MLNKILIADDEKNIRDLIKYNLKNDKYQVITASDGEQAYIKAHENVDLIVLDIMIPIVDGLEVCRRIRKDEGISDIAVIMLTAKDKEIDRILGLEIGADDYITKPFSIRELKSRIKAVLRRTKTDSKKEKNKNSFISDKLQIDLAGYEVKKNGKIINLTPKEFELLKLMYNNANMVLTRDLLIDKIWGFQYTKDSRTLDVHIRRLRKKIGDDYLQTVRGLGYKFINKNSSL